MRHRICANTSHDTHDVTLLTGGFGPVNGSHCPGIESVTLHTSDIAGITGTVAEAASVSVSLHKNGLLADVPSPTWMERDGNVLYATLEDVNELAAFRIERDSNADNIQLTLLSRVRTPGVSPTHATVAVDDLGAKHLIVACYVDGHVCVHPIADDGSLLDATQILPGEGHGPLPAQEGPHAHWILPLPDGRILSTDLGADRIYVHHWHDGKLVRAGAVTLAPGTGPRDMHLLPTSSDDGYESDWRVAVVDEWGDTVTVLGPSSQANTASDGIIVLQTVDLGGDDLDQAASLAFVPWSVLRGDGSNIGAAGSDDTDDNDGAGGVAYVGLRGSERIVPLLWNGEHLSRLAPIDDPSWRGRGVDCGGRRPRHLLPVGNLLLAANEVSDNLSVFRLSANGMPVHTVDLPSGSPTVFVRL